MKTDKYLNEQIEIPDIVLKKEEDTFAQIRKGCDQKTKKKGSSYRKPLTFRSIIKKPVYLAAVIALIVLGCGTAIAAVATNFWSRGLDAAIEADSEQRISLEERGFVKNIDMEPITVNGVTVTPVTAITDGTVGYISLKISGYELEEGGVPMFDSKGEFYITSENTPDYLADINTPGITWGLGGSNMTGFYHDGNNIGYTDEDGNLEYIAEIILTEGSLFGNTIKFEMDDLGTRNPEFSKDEPNSLRNVAEGEWKFDISFQTEEEADISTASYEMNRNVSDTGCIIKMVTVSPLSIIIDYTITQAGDRISLEQLVMSDGEVIDLNNPYYSYHSAPEKVSQTITALGRVIDVKEIDSIVVHYSYSKTGEYLQDTIKLEGSEVAAAGTASPGEGDKAADQALDNNTDVFEEEVAVQALTSETIELTDIEKENFKGKMMIINDPSQVFLGTVSEFPYGEIVYTIMSHYDGVCGGINGGSIQEMSQDSYTGMPLGFVISEGTLSLCTAADMDEKFHAAGFTAEGKLVMGQMSAKEAIEKNLRDAVCTDAISSPFLIIDGQVSDEVPGESEFGGGANPRTVIGQKEDGTVIMIAIDGRQSGSIGATYAELVDLLKEYDIYNACAMMGGTTSQMIYMGELQNHPYTGTPGSTATAWLVR